MQKRNLILLAFSILVLAALACNTVLPTVEPAVTALPTQTQAQNDTNPQPPLTEAQVPRIPVDEAKSAYDSGQAVIVDVRSAGSYAESHTAGAISIPLDEFENNISTIPLEKDQWIITYCT